MLTSLAHDDLLVGAIVLIRTLPCLAEPGKLIVIGETDTTIDAVMPLLNATLPNVISYYPLAGVMSLRRRPGLITLYPQRVQITQVDDVDDGLRMLVAVRDLLNQTWARRDQIEPKTETRRIPRPLDVYELLPRSNCRGCGAATCMAFAFGLLENRYDLHQCPGLGDAAFDARRQTLIDMLPPRGQGGERQVNLHAL
jgi:ArsR family metal-binding transcriptional regulator